MTPIEEATRIAARFAISQPIQISDFDAKGNINLDAFLVTTAEGKRYLLQRLNSDVFAQPERVMAGMRASLEAQRSCLSSGNVHSDTCWQAMEMVPTASGDPYLNGSVDETWRMVTFIEGTANYKSLNDVPAEEQIAVAREVGRGLAIYSDLTASIDPDSIVTSLPGYRDTRTYFRQFHASLAGHTSVADVEHLLPEWPEARAASERHFLCALAPEEARSRREDPELAAFIESALDYEPLAMTLQQARESGEIRTTVIHGDTKIENFLFDKITGKVVSLVDLDTVMPLTWLADWGDMVRSLANPAGEKETNLEKVVVSREAYKAVTEGFLSTASSPTRKEIELMPTAVQAITVELGVRFLADYLRGDTYFGLSGSDPRDLNKRRAMVQIRLFQQLLEHENEARQLLAAR